MKSRCWFEKLSTRDSTHTLSLSLRFFLPSHQSFILLSRSFHFLSFLPPTPTPTVCRAGANRVVTNSGGTDPCPPKTHRYLVDTLALFVSPLAICLIRLLRPLSQPITSSSVSDFVVLQKGRTFSSCFEGMNENL